jgi:alpha-L-fucosidase
MAFTLTDYWRHFLNSVGIGMVNTVNAPPGTTGQIHKSIATVMQDFGAAIRPLYLPDASAGPESADCGSLVVYLDITKGFNAVVSREDLSQGQRLASYTVEALQGITWEPLAPVCSAPVVSTQMSTSCIHGLSVGAMVVDLVDRVHRPPRQLRFRCLESLQDPVFLQSFAVAEVDLPSELW